MLDIDYQFRPRQLRALLLLLVLLPFVPAVITFRFMFESLESEKLLMNEQASTFYQNHLEIVTKAAVEAMETEIQQLANASTASAFREKLPKEQLEAVYPSDFLPDSKRLSESVAQAAAGFSRTASPGQWRALPGSQPLYGCLIRPAFRPEGIVLIETRDRLQLQLQRLIAGAFGTEGRVQVTDEFPATANDPPRIVSAIPGSFFPSWRVVVDLDPSLWQSDFRQQASFYLSASLLLGAVILGISSLAAYGVLKQLRLQSQRLTTLAVLAHELKTPIASSRVLLETLQVQKSPSPDFVQDYAGLLREQNERLGRTVQNLLTLAKFEMGRAQPHFEPLEISELIEEAAQPFRHLLKSDETRYRTDIAPGLRPLQADRSLLLLALGNLIENAIKYTPPPRQIEVAARERAGTLEILVRDNGPGIETNAQTLIFEPFQQGDNRLARTTEGCGLGLGIVRHVMRAHAGEVQLVSARNQGSTFTLRFPIHTGHNSHCHPVFHRPF